MAAQLRPQNRGYAAPQQQQQQQHHAPPHAAATGPGGAQQPKTTTAAAEAPARTRAGGDVLPEILEPFLIHGEFLLDVPDLVREALHSLLSCLAPAQALAGQQSQHDVQPP